MASAEASRISLSDELYLRPDRWRIFVSSQMKGAPLSAERSAAVDAIEKTGLADAWCWERDASAGPYSSEPMCLNYARASDGLVLILGARLTRMTQREYEAAFDDGAPCYIFVKDGVAPSRAVRQFINAQRLNATTKNFRNISELETHITKALFTFAIRAGRKERASIREQRAKTTRGTGRTRR